MGFLDYVEVIKMVDGDLIHKVAYETVCSEGFLGNKELDYVIHKPDFKEEDVSGPFMKPYFPEPRCSWESTKSHVKVFLFKELHPIRMDIYDGSYVSPLFPGGKCHHVGCLTIHSNVFWLPSKPAEKNCPKTVKEMVDVTTFEGKLHLDIPDTGSFPLELVCHMDLCMKTGLKLGSGEWVEADLNDIKALNIPICQDQTIQMRHEIDAREYTRMTHYSQLRMVSCMESISKMSTSSSVNNLDLSKLSPIRSGTGKAYRYCNGRLEESLAIYRDITPDKLLVSSRKCGFNGLYWTNKWIIPNKNLLNEEARVKMIRRKVFNSVKHPTLRVISESVQSENWTEGTGDFEEEISGYNKYILIAGVILLILLILLFAFCKLYHNTPPVVL